MGLQVGLPDAVMEEARQIANAVEAADASVQTRAVEAHASEMHEGKDLSARRMHLLACSAALA